uniref:Uncharacterized protein n=1 Tax=Zea mays TaxID=4577 RepID=A0A804PTW4_MAIZE
MPPPPNLYCPGSTNLTGHPHREQDNPLHRHQRSPAQIPLSSLARHPRSMLRVRHQCSPGCSTHSPAPPSTRSTPPTARPEGTLLWPPVSCLPRRTCTRRSPPPPLDLSPHSGSGGRKAGRRPKWVAVAATGMVADVIGKEYTRSTANSVVSMPNAWKGRDGESDGDGSGGRKDSVEEAE